MTTASRPSYWFGLSGAVGLTLGPAGRLARAAIGTAYAAGALCTVAALTSLFASDGQIPTTTGAYALGGIACLAIGFAVEMALIAFGHAADSDQHQLAAAADHRVEPA